MANGLTYRDAIVLQPAFVGIEEVAKFLAGYLLVDAHDPTHANPMVSPDVTVPESVALVPVHVVSEIAFAGVVLSRAMQIQILFVAEGSVMTAVDEPVVPEQTKVPTAVPPVSVVVDAPAPVHDAMVNFVPSSSR